MHKSGIFETKAANYSQGKIEIAYGQDFDTKGLKDKCIERLNCAQATIPNGVFLRLNGMIKNWDNMDDNERKQLFDMIILYCGD